MTGDELAHLQARAYTDAAPWSAADFTSLLGQSTVHLLTGPNSFLLVRIVMDEAEVLALATDPQAQRQGQARSLMTQFHLMATAQGVIHAFLEVSASNTAAQALYVAQGYVVCGNRAGYYRLPDGTRADAVLMSRALPGE